MQASSIAQVDTAFSADCIEWCPFEPFQDIFVCGTYQVLEPKSTPLPAEVNTDEDSDDDIPEEEVVPMQTQRTGRLLVFTVGEEQSTLQEVQRIDTPAILDAKWSPKTDEAGRPILAVADAKGHITTYALNTLTRLLEEVQSVRVDEETILCLSLDWSHRLHPETTPQIITSLSNGSLAHLVADQTGEYEIETYWHAHDFEPWCATWDNWDVNSVWSGGDDLKLKRWDIRSPSFPTYTNKRFDAGITTITSSPYTPNLLAVGSYDSNLRIYDGRSPTTPLRTIDLGGGIWRARFHPDPIRQDEILVACMHDGFKVVKLDPSITGTEEASLDGLDKTDDEDGCEIVKRFDGHDSLAYGADWSRLPGDGSGDSLIATCSFYDHKMHLWRA